MNITVDRQTIAEANQKLSNHGRWGKDDCVGTLNHVQPEDIVAAAGLIRSGKVFALCIPSDSGQIENATRWHAHAANANFSGIEHCKAKMTGRGVLLDVARFRGVPWLEDGEAVSNAELDKCAKDQNVALRRGDFVILRTGKIERCLKQGWDGYAGGNAPGVKFENCYWAQDKQIAALSADTWGVEVRPNETPEANQPWHIVVSAAIGLSIGENFYLKELAEDCADDGVYEFFFCGPPPAINGNAAPVNPQAVK